MDTGIRTTQRRQPTADCREQCSQLVRCDLARCTQVSSGSAVSSNSFRAHDEPSCMGELSCICKGASRFRLHRPAARADSMKMLRCTRPMRLSQAGLLQSCIDRGDFSRSVTRTLPSISDHFEGSLQEAAESSEARAGRFPKQIKRPAEATRDVYDPSRLSNRSACSGHLMSTLRSSGWSLGRDHWLRFAVRRLRDARHQQAVPPIVTPIRIVAIIARCHNVRYSIVDSSLIRVASRHSSL
jgi:hypothetical protein